ncbi:GDSL-type esterase/lipase family protein, partial [Escherichia coli]
FGYANLAIRGRTMRPILDEQLEPALALEPDLVTIYAGGNDLIRPRCDVDALGEVYDEAVGKLSATGATVGLFTAFDPGGGG